MTAPAAVAPAPTTRSRSGSRYRLSFAHLLSSEWIKIWSVRSTWWALAVAAVLSIGISMLIAAATANSPSPFPAISTILLPTQFTMLVAGILGAIVVTGEYSTGMIRSTLTAAPRRGAVLVAKAIVISLIVAITTILIYAIAIAATSSIVPQGIDWSEPSQSIVPLMYGVLAMVAYTLIGLGFGFLIRNGAGAIAATVGVLFVLPIVLSLFSIAGEGWRWIVDLTKYLPSNAGGALATPGAEDVVPSLLALAGWVVVPVVLGWLVLRSRDA
ncbi:ABC transporter permease [Microbacterium rhizomatis]|uniref:ABC transporter permease subunit n=1 Tax=Microbacterium rhizomatis TaxID=1631477 RepID=A0A5J5J2U8_9MICO|nr:ABC transporter permease subunit [Microbacterium rhizomatis]KAA9110406.1 ABC transporter permease subunit [Microbacterium rhizomatis]